VTSFAMIEVVLLAAAGVTVIAHRRLRQFGMLAATGATDRHLRQAMIGNGMAVGLVGGIAGIVAGMAAFVATRRGFEELVGFRVIDPFAAWWIVLPTVGLGMVACVAAAWWPARMVARTSVTDALASRRPRPLPAGRSATAGLVAAGSGAAVLSLGFNRANGWLAFAGLLAAVVGVLLLAPAAIRAVGAASVHLPVGARIAARELARHQSRSAAAVAALVLVLGIPAAIAVTTASADVSGDGETVNLDDSMVIVWPAGEAGLYRVPSDFDAEAHRAVAERLAETLGPLTTLVDIDVAVDPEVVFQSGGGRGQPGDEVPPLAVVSASRPIPGEDGALTGGMAWVATPAMLAALGLDPDLAQSPVAALSDRADPPIFGGVANPVTAEQVGLPALSSIPDDLITAAGVERGDYEVRTVGWLLVAGGPLTAGQRSAAIDQVAADPALEVELPAGSTSSETLRFVVAVVGSVVALAIMAMVISLVRSESAAELRSLAAVGASNLTQRGITAASAGLLSLAGAVLAIPLGYLALLAIMSDRAARYPFVVPVSSLSMLVIGVPLAATAAGWLFGGREPAAMARTPLG
jgi:putative ABC transport system permease protein